MTHFVARDVLTATGVRDSPGCWCGGATYASVGLAAGDTAENPANPAAPIPGPGSVTYVQHGDVVSASVQYGANPMAPTSMSGSPT